MDEWGITLLEADEEADAGASGPRASSPRATWARAACTATRSAAARSRPSLEAMTKLGQEGYKPDAAGLHRPEVTGRLRPLIRQPDRAIDWGADTTAASCARSAPPRATPACSTRSRASTSSSSARTSSAACAAAPARSSPPAMARSAARPSTAPSGSRTRRRATPSSCPPTRALELEGVASTRRSSRSPLHAPIPAGHTFREISYEERGLVATCTSTSTTAR